MSLTARKLRRQEKQAARVEVTPGHFKRIGRCSEAELVAASTLNYAKQRIVVDVLELLNELDQRDDLGLGDVPDWFAPASRAAIVDESAPSMLTLEDLTRFLEDLGRWHRAAASTRAHNPEKDHT